MKYRSAGLLGLAGDDERRAGLVDEDVVDLVDDPEEALALDPLVELRDHVVAEVVEPELVVRAVGDVRGVGLAARDRLEVHEPLVVGRVARLVDVRGRAAIGLLAQDHPDRHAQEVEDRPHPLGVAAGEVVVDGDDVHAAVGDRVEDGRERGHEGLALAGPHLGDLALVEHDATDQLDVEVAHPEGPNHRLAGHREGLGEDVVEGQVDRGDVAPTARLAQLATALEVGMVELVVGRLLGRTFSLNSSRSAVNLSRISASERALSSSSSSLASSTNGWIRFSSRSFESTNREKKLNIGPFSIGGSLAGPSEVLRELELVVQWDAVLADLGQGGFQRPSEPRRWRRLGAR